MLRIPADITDLLRCFLLRPGIVDQLERLSPGSSHILIFDCKIYERCKIYADDEGEQRQFPSECDLGCDEAIQGSVPRYHRESL